MIGFDLGVETISLAYALGLDVKDDAGLRKIEAFAKRAQDAAVRNAINRAAEIASRSVLSGYEKERVSKAVRDVRPHDVFCWHEGQYG